MLYQPNIAEQRWLLLDFDSARRINEETQINTLFYTAPELAVSKLTGNQAYATTALDIWGLGRIIHFMATAEPFYFGNPSGEEILRCLTEGDENLWVPDNALDERTLPEVRALLAKDPTKRKRLDVFKVLFILELFMP